MWETGTHPPSDNNNDKKSNHHIEQTICSISEQRVAANQQSLFRDLEEIRGETALPDNGISDLEKFARIVAEEPKYRS